MHRYAAYGSNLHPRRLGERIASATLIGTSYLREYTLRFHKRGKDLSAKCGFSRCGQGMHVAVYEMDTAGKHDLDRIEGVGRGYEVHDVDVPGYGRCFTYLAEKTHIDDLLHPFDWYREMVWLGCLKHAFPEAYCQRIAALPVQADPDLRRRQRNWELVELMRAD